MNNKEYAGNIGLPAMAGTVVNSTFVHLINFSACGQVSAYKPPLRQAENVGRNAMETAVFPTVLTNDSNFLYL
jgi:hypothetical protein